eukprot:3225211-Karenia_brevis.AAC.1
MDEVLTTSHRAGHRPTTPPAARARGKGYGSAYSHHHPDQQGRHRPKNQLERQVKEQNLEGSAPPAPTPTRATM